MLYILKKGLQATEDVWEPLGRVYAWVHQLAHILGDADPLRIEGRQLSFAVILLSMQEQSGQLASVWQQAVAHFLKVTASYGPHLFFCYQIPEVPRTNNDLEQAFGQVRFHERRATGRRKAFPGLVVYGAARIQATLATRLHAFTADELALHDVQAWRALRAQRLPRWEGRGKQLRFRKEPVAYLAALEARLLKTDLPS